MVPEELDILASELEGRFSQDLKSRWNDLEFEELALRALMPSSNTIPYTAASVKAKMPCLLRFRVGGMYRWSQPQRLDISI